MTDQFEHADILNREPSDFEKAESHVDSTFLDLPKRAQEIAFEIMTACAGCANPIRSIVAELDSSECFRQVIGCTDMDKLPQEVDCVVRYYEWHYLKDTMEVINE